MSEVSTIEQFAERLAQAEAEEPAEEVENAQPEEEAQSDEPADETPTEVDQEESSDEAEAEGDQPETESLDSRVVSWETASGDKFEVPVAELKLGYMREQDYRHKTQTFAQEREQAAQQIQQRFQQAEAFAQEVGQFTLLNNQVAQLESVINQTNQHDDPIGYNTAVSQYLMLQRQRDGLANHLGQVQQQRQQEEVQREAQAKAQAFAELQGKVPGFSREMLHKSSNVLSEKYGLTAAELSKFTNPKLIHALIDAAKFADVQAKAPQAVKKVTAAPPKPTKQSTAPVDSDISKQIKQFKGKKDINSFAALLAKTL